MGRGYITRNLRQVATYWATGAPDGFGGLSLSAPVPIKCRWEDRTELIRSPNSGEITTTARVYVDQDVDIEGYLFLGSSVVTDPTTVAGAREIRDFKRLPDIRGRIFERTARL